MALSLSSMYGNVSCSSDCPALHQSADQEVTFTDVVHNFGTPVPAGRQCSWQTLSCCSCLLTVVLLQIDNWNTFDVFQVGNLSKGAPLESVTLALFARHDLLAKLNIPYDRLQHFVRVRLAPSRTVVSMEAVPTCLVQIGTPRTLKTVTVCRPQA